MKVQTCDNCGNAFLMDYDGKCPVCADGETVALSDLLPYEQLETDHKPKKYMNIETMMHLNSDGMATIRTPSSDTEWISSDYVEELQQ